MELVSKITSYITESSLSRQKVKYKIRDDFKVKDYSELEILKTIMNDMSRNEIVTFEIDQQKLIFENKALKNKHHASIFLNHPLAGDLNVTDFGEIKLETKDYSRYVLFNYSIHSLFIKYLKNLVIWLFIIGVISLYSQSSSVFLLGFSAYLATGIMGYIFLLMRHQTLIKRIIIREELRVNNEL